MPFLTVKNKAAREKIPKNLYSLFIFLFFRQKRIQNKIKGACQ